MNEDKIRRLVIFAILMENNNGIIDKVPDYIWEKYFLAMNTPYPENLLDQWNRAKYEKYLKRWHLLGDKPK